MTSQLVGRYKHLVIEDLNVKGMMQGSTPKAQADAAMGAIRRKLEYKAPWHHCRLGLAHRPYPSSKTCSNCQQVNAKLKRERYWQYPNCAATHERNINAAVNLLTLPAGSGVTLRDGKALAGSSTAGGAGQDDRRTAPPDLQARQR